MLVNYNDITVQLIFILGMCVRGSTRFLYYSMKSHAKKSVLFGSFFLANIGLEMREGRVYNRSSDNTMVSRPLCLVAMD